MNIRWKIAQAAEIRWWQNYLRKQSTTDYLTWKENYWITFLERLHLNFSKEEKILDAGCGPAGIFMVLRPHQVTAIDPLLDSYREKIAHFKARNYPNVRFHSAAIEQFDFKKTYHKVFCLNAINHVADLALCLDKIVACLRPKGQFILSIDAHNYPFFKQIFRLFPGDILHPHQYDLKEYQDMLTQRGIQIQQTILYKEEFFFNYYVLVGQK